MAGGGDFAISVRMTDNSGAALEELKEKTARALFAMGVTAVEGAVDSISGKYQAVDTGRLRASISFITSEASGTSGETAPNSQSGDTLSGTASEGMAVIGSNVEYASFVELGTSKMAARPFLSDGIQTKIPDMQRQVESIYKGTL